MALSATLAVTAAVAALRSAALSINATALVDWRARDPVPSSLVAFNSTDGAQLLVDQSTERDVFMQVMQHFVTQRTQTLCGVATSVTILNSLKVAHSVDQWFYPYQYETQDTFFTPCVTNIIPFPTVMRIGMTMQEVVSAVDCFPGVKTRSVFASSSSVDGFRTAASEALANGHAIACNFARTGLDQEGGGHWSPLVAYSKTEDRFLLLDVSRYKYPPVFATSEQLFTAMDTTDSTSGLSRGWVEVYAG